MRRGVAVGLAAMGAVLAAGADPVPGHAVVAAGSGSASRTAPPTQESLFEEGNRLYQEGDFAGAAASYGAVIEGGFESAEVYYNLGNAHFRLGETARAVLSYKRARRLDPGNDDIRANLALVSQRLQDRIEPLPRFWLLSVFDWWMGLVPGGMLRALVAVCYLLLGASAVLIVMRRPSGWRGPLRRFAYGAAVATVLLGATLLIRETGLGRAEEAVVMAGEARVLSAPSEEGGLIVFTLHEGTSVRIDRRAGDWAEIVLADGKVGWLPLEVLEIV